LVVGQAGNGAATLGEDFLATIRAELSAAVEKSGPRILTRRSDQIGGSGISSGNVEIAMLKPTCRQFDERYCAAHRNMDRFVRAMVRQGSVSIDQRAGVGFFFIWTVLSLGGLARSENDNVRLRQTLVAPKIVQPAYPRSTMETK
jgi:hypothetical protein